jgi:hypothetical protein
MSEIFFLFMSPYLFWGPLSLLPNRDQDCFSDRPGGGVKWMGHEADYSPPTSAKAKTISSTYPLPIAYSNSYVAT